MNKEPLLCQFIDEIEDLPSSEFITDFRQFLTEKLKVFSPQESLSSKQVLMLTRKFDPEADFVGIGLLQRGIDYVRLNNEDISDQQLLISFTVKPNINLRAEFSARGQQVLDTSKISVVWLRQFDIKDVNFNGSGLANTFSFQQWDDALITLQGILSTACVWISSPNATLKARDRVQQLSIANRLGFDIPCTLITNDPRAALDFYHSHGEDIVLKALHHHDVEVQGKLYSMYSHRVLSQDLSKLDNLIYAPCILQQRIPKKSDLRVTVVGDQVFAAELHSKSTEKGFDDDLHRSLQRNSLSISAIELEDTISERCIKVIKSLGLTYGAIDFVIGNNDDRLSFLEVNPTGDWYWIERKTGLPITKAFVDLIEELMAK